MNLERFSAINRQRCEGSGGFNQPIVSWSMNDWFTATLGELGEAANASKKLKRSEDGIRGNKEDDAYLREHLKREIGDVGIYLDLLAQRAGFTLGECIIAAFDSKSDDMGWDGPRLASLPNGL